MKSYKSISLDLTYRRAISYFLLEYATNFERSDFGMYDGKVWKFAFSFHYNNLSAHLLYLVNNSNLSFMSKYDDKDFPNINQTLQ